jgi:hypothetical protein
MYTILIKDCYHIAFDIFMRNVATSSWNYLTDIVYYNML